MNDPIVGTTVLNRYRIVARLAAGGMGVVYLARVDGAAGFAKPVVVKRILPEHTRNENMARLFVREAKILANLQHPNIVGVTDFGEEGGAYIMVLDYVRAYHLGLWLFYRDERGEKLPAAGSIHIMTKVLEALDYAHGLALPDGTPLDIIHADISPSNILVDTEGQVKLLDFGIARMRGEVTKSTDAASIRGKLAYLPLEALDGSAPRVATDVYACGVTLYELLAGKNPFTNDDDTVTIARVISHTPEPISTLRSEVPPELDAILARAMSKDRTQRFATAKDFARELRRIQPLPEDESAQSLARIARQDYAAMPEMEKLGAISLSDLEEAWRNPPAPSAAVSAREQLAFAPTLAPDGNAATRVSAQLPSNRGAIIGISALVVVFVAVVATVAVFVLRRPESTDEPKVILVEHSAATPAASPAEPAKLTPIPSEVASSAETHDAGRTTPKPPPQDSLSAAFAKNQPQIEGCFRDQAAGVKGSPEISVRFTIDTAGVVQRAEIVPAEITELPLGQCILGIAKRTQFPTQNASTTFRIPLRARRAQ